MTTTIAIRNALSGRATKINTVHAMMNKVIAAAVRASSAGFFCQHQQVRRERGDRANHARRNCKPEAPV